VPSTARISTAATHEDIATSTAKQRLYAKRFEDVVTALRQHETAS